MTRRAYYKKTIYYDEAFVKDIDLFEQIITHKVILDKLPKLQNDTQRFSAVIRYMITRINAQFGYLLKEKKETTPNKNTENEVTK